MRAQKFWDLPIVEALSTGFVRVILFSMWPEGCLHCLVGKLKSQKIWRQKRKWLWKQTSKRKKESKVPLERQAANGYWIAAWTLIWEHSLNNWKKREAAVSVQVKGGATVQWSPFVRSVIYGPLVLLSCSGLPASVHCVLYSDVAPHGWTATSTKGSGPTFQA